MRNLAALDVGKTNAEDVLVDAASTAGICLKKSSSPVSDYLPFAHFDTERFWPLLLSSLEDFGRRAKQSRLRNHSRRSRGFGRRTKQTGAVRVGLNAVLSPAIFSSCP